MSEQQRTRQHGTPARTPEQQPSRDGVDRSADALALIDDHYSKFPRQHRDAHSNSTHRAPRRKWTDDQASINRAIDKQLRQPNYARRRGLVFGGLAVAAGLTLLAANHLEDDDSSVSARETTAIEKEAFQNPKVGEGTLVIGPGANVRHEPIIRQADESAGLFDEDVDPAFTLKEGQSIQVENMLVGGANDDWFGFEVNNTDGIEDGIYWIAESLTRDSDENGRNYASLLQPIDAALAGETTLTASVQETQDGTQTIVSGTGAPVGQAVMTGFDQ